MELVLLLVIYLVIDGGLGFPIANAAGSGAMNGYRTGRDERRRQIDAELSKSKKGKRILARRQRNRAVRAAVWQALQTGAASGWDAGADRRAKQWAWAQATTRRGGVHLLGWLATAREQLSGWLGAAREQLSKIRLPEPDGTEAAATPDPQQQGGRGPQQAPAADPQQPAVPSRRPTVPAGAPTPATTGSVATAGSAVVLRPEQPSSPPPRPQFASAPLPDRPNEILAATVRSENIREDQGLIGVGQRVTCREHECYRTKCCAKAVAVV